MTPTDEGRPFHSWSTSASTVTTLADRCRGRNRGRRLLIRAEFAQVGRLVDNESDASSACGLNPMKRSVQ